MRGQTSVVPWWAVLTVWGIVNAVNLLQAAGFLSRVPTGSRAINHVLGYVMIALAIPAALALVALARARAGWRQWIGPAAYLAFIAFMVAVEYVWAVEFRSPARAGILVPYLLLFFGAILLMGLPMFRLDRRLWWVTVAVGATVFVAVAGTDVLVGGTGVGVLVAGIAAFVGVFAQPSSSGQRTRRSAFSVPLAQSSGAIAGLSVMVWRPHSATPHPHPRRTRPRSPPRRRRAACPAPSRGRAW